VQDKICDGRLQVRMNTAKQWNGTNKWNGRGREKDGENARTERKKWSRREMKRIESNRIEIIPADSNESNFLFLTRTFRICNWSPFFLVALQYVASML